MIIKGIGVSPGIAIGPVFILDQEQQPIRRSKIPEAAVAKEIKKFHLALEQTRAQLQDISAKIVLEMGSDHAGIFNAQRMILDDPALTEEVVEGVRKQRVNVEAVFYAVIQKYMKTFSAMSDEYMKDRGLDVQDVGRRLIRNLVGLERVSLAQLDREVIVIARDIAPSDTAQMHREKVSAFATDMGGRTSHTAIMARSLEIPAVVGLKALSQKVREGETIIVDGTQGLVITDPDASTIQHYTQEQKKYHAYVRELKKLRKLPAETLDGYRIVLAANIETPEDTKGVVEHGAEGVGLYRTEFLFMNRETVPTEEEQYEAYRKVAQNVLPSTVTIRTMDLGGDKYISYLNLPKEVNPFLGMRAIRLCLAKPEIFKIQLRAILRASAHAKVKIMYPMICCIEELRRANKLLEEAKQELKREKVDFDPKIPVGIMIELPSAVMAAEFLAREADFFSIGTNDLIQYSLGVDRVNENVSYLYDPLHPAILRLIKMTVDAAHREGIRVSLCGEMGGEPLFTQILLGIGIDEISTASLSVPVIKKLIRTVSFTESKDLANKIMTLDTAREIRDVLRQRGLPAETTDP